MHALYYTLKACRSQRPYFIIHCKTQLDGNYIKLHFMSSPYKDYMALYLRVCSGLSLCFQPRFDLLISSSCLPACVAVPCYFVKTFCMVFASLQISFLIHFFPFKFEGRYTCVSLYSQEYRILFQNFFVYHKVTRITRTVSVFSICQNG